jgi:hypothetical protein
LGVRAVRRIDFVFTSFLSCFYQFRQVLQPTAVVLDWKEEAIISDVMTSIMKPAYSSRTEAVEPPTTLENLLQAYVEEEQLTGANQWRCVDVVD